jgi:hypothetical protein
MQTRTEKKVYPIAILCSREEFCRIITTKQIAEKRKAKLVTIRLNTERFI